MRFYHPIHRDRTSKRMHGMNQTEAASFIISDIIPKVNYLSSHVSTCRRPILLDNILAI